MNNKNKVFIIAEIGVNHNGSLEMAKALIDAAAQAGVDAVKFQSFNTDLIMTPDVPKADYQIKNTSLNESQYEMLKKLELNQQMQLLLKEHSTSQNVQFLSTPFDVTSLDFLVNRLNIPVIKIASGEITNAPLLLNAAHSGRKIILSTGMSALGDIEEALGILAFGYGANKKHNPSRKLFKAAYCSEAGQLLLNQKVTLLHCTTEYPAPYEEVNLSVISTLKQCFGLKVGYSDHTLGISIALAAAALGASVIEKHVTMDKKLPGPDHRASLNPNEFAEMVRGIRQIERAIGIPYKKPTPSEIKNQSIVRKSIVAARDINKGELFTIENLIVKRPEGGLSPVYYWELLGKRALREYQKNEVII